MKNMNGEVICGEIWTKDYHDVASGSGLSQRTETFYCTKKPNHLGAHVATYEGGPKEAEYPDGPFHGKILKAWVT